MNEQLEVSGVVIGRAGEIVGGFARLGAQGTKHALGGTVRVRTDDGREVELVDLLACGIDPVVTTKAEWQELEREPGARACLPDAPAPDITVELKTSALRGGDRVAMLGDPRRQAFTDGAGAAFRESAATHVTQLAPVVVFVGEDAAERLAKVRAAANMAISSPFSTPVARVAPSTPKAVEGSWRIPASYGWFLLLIVMFLTSFGSGYGHVLLLVAAAIACLPIFFDIAASPRVMRGTTTTSRGRPVMAVAIASTLVLVFTLAPLIEPLMPSEAHDMYIASLVGGGVLAVCLAWLVATYLRRTRVLALIEKSPPQSSPVVDGTWGYVDGMIDTSKALKIGTNSAVIASGENISTAGAGKNTTRRTSPNNVVASDAWVSTSAGTLALPIKEATWVSCEHFEEPVGKGHVRATLLRPGQPVRVVGRLAGGLFVQGGTDSLLVFGAPLAKPMTAALETVLTLANVSQMNASLGVVCAVTAIVVAMMR